MFKKEEEGKTKTHPQFKKRKNQQTNETNARTHKTKQNKIYFGVLVCLQREARAITTPTAQGHIEDRKHQFSIYLYLYE